MVKSSKRIKTTTKNKSKDVKVVNKKSKKKNNKNNLSDEEKKRIYEENELLYKKYDPSRMFLDLYNFKLEYINDYTMKSVLALETGIDRKDSLLKLKKIVKFDYIANKIENGLFEFTLSRKNYSQCHVTLLSSIYNDQLDRICKNLDVTDKRINNQHLFPAVMSHNIDPFILAFLSASQMHPKRWFDQLEKQRSKNNLTKELPTTSMYKCRNCGARKSTVAQLQIRSADEPMTLFITCVVCYTMFTKNG